MLDITEIAGKIYHIPNHAYGLPDGGSAYFLNEEHAALVEIGPPTSVPTVLDGLRHLNVSPAAIEYIIVTHVHVDHAGGAGLILQSLPNAMVVVHPRGAKHLVDPTKLVAGMRAIQGDEHFRADPGEVVPVPSERIISLTDSQKLELSSKQQLTFYYAPGHAPHQYIIHESRNNGVFSGDSAGALVGEGKVIIPTMSPPSFNLDQFVQTIDKIIALKPSAIYYSHCGMSRNVTANLQTAKEIVLKWDEIAKKTLADGSECSLADRMGEYFFNRVRCPERLCKPISQDMDVCAQALIQYNRDRQSGNK